MFRCVYTAAALSLTSFAFGQAAPSLQLETPNLLKDPSFELPAVKGRLSTTEGGNPESAGEEKTSWIALQVEGKDKPNEGVFTVGLTNEFARTGKQSIFVDLNKFTSVERKSFLMSDLVPVKPGHVYQIGLWGRTDPKRPLTLDQRLLYMKVEVEYLTPDTENQSGELDNRTLMVPGNSKRIFFVSNKWNEYTTKVRAPRDAGWMKVTFRWEIGREKGTTDGTIYFDDASITLLPGGDPLIPIDESDAAKPVPDEGTEADEAAAPAGTKAPEKK